MAATFLRPYQKEGEDKIFAAWKAGDKNVMYQLVTGGGKTVLFVDIIKKFLLKKRRVMLIAHREELISQAWNTLYRNQIYAGIIKGDVKPNFALPCQVASIQTIIRRQNLPAADLVIIDEAHHSQEENSYGTVLERHFSGAYVLGVTATPYRLSGEGFTSLFDTLICGPKFTELVDWGYLTPLRYFVAGIPDLRGVKIQGGDYNQEQAEKAMDLVPLVDSYFEHCEGMAGVVFAVNIRHSQNIVDQYNAAGVPAAHLDANTPAAERKKILDDFKKGVIKVISNVGIITEGFDFPDMEFVQLARPTLSLSLYLQMVGRVTRTDYKAIKDATSDDHRRQLVAASKKPFGYVLDNAGLYKTHGLPDQDFNWPRYFQGIDRKAKKEKEVIEMLEFVAEDEDGRQVRTTIPEEVDGLKLIEVNKTIKEKIISSVVAKELDRLLEMFKRLPKVQKKGWAAFYQFRDHCRKNNILITPELWDYLYKRLWTDAQEALAKEFSARDQAIDTVRIQYAHNPEERDRLVANITQTSTARVQLLTALSVPGGAIRAERKKYEAALAEAEAKTKSEKALA